MIAIVTYQPGEGGADTTAWHDFQFAAGEPVEIDLAKANNVAQRKAWEQIIHKANGHPEFEVIRNEGESVDFDALDKASAEASIAAAAEANAAAAAEEAGEAAEARAQADELEALRLEAHGLGMVVDGRWSADTLRQKIADGNPDA